MFFGIDLTGEERERYEAVRAARIKMERDGTPSPFIRCKNPGYCQTKGVSNDAPRNVLKLLEWIGNKKRFDVKEAARDLGCSTATIYKGLTYLRATGQTSARSLLGGGNVTIRRRKK